MGAAASLRSLVITPLGDPSVVLVTVLNSVVVLTVVRKGKIGTVTLLTGLVAAVVVVLEVSLVDVDAVLDRLSFVFAII